MNQGFRPETILARGEDADTPPRRLQGGERHPRAPSSQAPSKDVQDFHPKPSSTSRPAQRNTAKKFVKGYTAAVAAPQHCDQIVAEHQHPAPRRHSQQTTSSRDREPAAPLAPNSIVRAAYSCPNLHRHGRLLLPQPPLPGSRAVSSRTTPGGHPHPAASRTTRRPTKPGRTLGTRIGRSQIQSPPPPPAPFLQPPTQRRRRPRRVGTRSLHR